MRFNAIALLAGALLVGACGGGNGNTDTAAVTTGDTATTATTTTPATGASAAAATPSVTGSATAMPATGKTHTVQMKAEGTSFVFDPANITVKQGDAIDFVMVSGAPHNVAFTDVPADAKAQLDANMPEKIAELAGKMLMNPNEKYTISFAGVKPGSYNYVCQPHAAMGMKGVVTVTQ